MSTKEKSHPLIMDWIFGHAWAITDKAFEKIVAIAGREDLDVQAAINIRDTYMDEGSDRAYIRGSTAILDIRGPIFSRANLFTEISGATSIERLSADFKAAMMNPAVKSILMQIDSPGGEVSGTSDFAAMVYESRKKKPIYAYGLGSVASGAYWIASAAEKIFIADTATLGSIGVVMGYRDTSKRDEKEGIKTIEIVSVVSPDKRLDIQSDDGRSKIQKTVNDLGDVFVATVAKHRNVNASDVTEKFGKGWVLVGQKAIDAGMADEIISMDALVNQLNMKANGGFRMSVATDEKKFSVAEMETAKAEAKTAGHAEGVKSENERIKAIESLQVPTACLPIVAQHKFDSTKTKEHIAVLVLEESGKTAAAALATRHASGEALATAAAAISTTASDAPAPAKGKEVIEDGVKVVHTKLNMEAAVAAANARS